MENFEVYQEEKFKLLNRVSSKINLVCNDQFETVYLQTGCKVYAFDLKLKKVFLVC